MGIYGEKWGFMGVFFLMFALAYGSKQNAATFPISLILIETIFFNKGKIRDWVGPVLMVSFAVFFIVSMNQSGGYEIRSFTMSERLLSQPRAMVKYLSLIFLPLPDRLSITHDFFPSRALFDPWTTFPAILIMFFVLVIGISNIKERPLLSFGILFYFLNHMIESSIIPLELFFEHRNYLPSMFLFVPVIMFFISEDKYEFPSFNKQIFVDYRTCFLVSLLIFTFCFWGLATYNRNETWKTEKSFWEDAIKKAPGSARPLQSYALHHYGPTDQPIKALDHYRRSLKLYSAYPVYTVALALSNMTVEYFKIQEYEKAIKVAETAVRIMPDFQAARNNLASAIRAALFFGGKKNEQQNKANGKKEKGKQGNESPGPDKRRDGGIKSKDVH